MCDCQIIGGGDLYTREIDYCPLHGAAEEMLEALKDTQYWLDHATTKQFEEGDDWLIRDKITNLIAKATGDN